MRRLSSRLASLPAARMWPQYGAAAVQPTGQPTHAQTNTNQAHEVTGQSNLMYQHQQIPLAPGLDATAQLAGAAASVDVQPSYWQQTQQPVQPHTYRQQHPQYQHFPQWATNYTGQQFAYSTAAQPNNSGGPLSQGQTRSDVRLCRFGARCNRADCWFGHPERTGVEGSNTAAAASSSLPAQAAAAAAAAHASAAAAVPVPPVIPVDPARPWRSQSKTDVWRLHPREDSFGCLVVAHADPSVTLDAASLSTTPVEQLRFLLVQRAGTSALNNLIVELQESPDIAGAKDARWVRREASRLTDSELDLLSADFDTLWHDATRVSSHWKLDFWDANESLARAKHGHLQEVADQLRAERHFRGRVEPRDDENLSKLNFVVPKGQLQTASSVQRLPHLQHRVESKQVIDVDERAAAVREVVEETEMPAVNFTLQASIPPLHFSQYPPRKVDVYLATLTSNSEYHPSVRPDWRPSPNPETRRCRWFSLQEIMHYFEQANVWRTTYTRIIIEQLIRRQGWQLEAGRQEGSNQPQQPSLPPPPQPSPLPQA